MTHGRVVFVLCSTRSGSTWLALMLGSNSRAQYVGELHRMYRTDPEGCALCSERGRPCPIFHDIAQLRPRSVHAALLERTGTDVLIDNSKSLSWARKTLGTIASKRYVHLLRDPRAVVQAWKSRGRSKGLERWIEENYQIRRFLEDQRLDYRVVSYNQLADDTDETLSGLCDWLDLTYEPAQKSYWDFEHHGAGRNGATASFLNTYVASDEAFYAKHRKENFHDLRWQSELDAATQQAIVEDARLQEFLSEFGFALSPAGLQRIPIESRRSGP